MHKSYNNIPIPKSTEKSLIVAKSDLLNYDKIVFDFTYFQAKSISINGFNNCYESKIDSINAVGDLFETFKNINSFNKKTFFTPNIKEQFHYNEYKNDEIINRIERILTKGYGMPYNKVEEFEKLYFEFSFNDGKRAIGTKIYDNIFSILFLDPNHLICENSCRNKKSKLMFSIPGIFEKWQKDTLSMKDFNRNEFLKMIIEDYNNGKYKTMDEIIDDIKSIIDEQDT